jgi:LSD1 subclass zinc finger protein
VTNSAFEERRQEDIKKLRELESATRGRVRVLKVVGNPANQIELLLVCKTAPGARFPEEVSDQTRVRIELPARYPFQEPSAVITTKIFHPNVYASGKICFGTKWLPTEGLDLLAKRIVKIITFDSSILNERSPANAEALQWYRAAVRRHPASFPTDSIVFGVIGGDKTIIWKERNNPEKVTEKSIVSCSGCKTQLRVPSGREGIIRCPSCGQLFQARS